MNWCGAHLNLIAAWLGVVAGFVAGFLFGSFFHREDWLGGYTSFKRRLYRLGHISFFGLAGVNFLFYLTAEHLGRISSTLAVASCGFVLGAITMPICCFAMAHQPQLRALFLIPVVSLITAGSLTLWEVIKL